MRHMCACTVNSPHIPPEHVDRYAQVVKELKERDTHAKKQDREVGKTSLESGQSDDPVHKFQIWQNGSYV